ncbi:hypothetical protein B0H10DRAFT_1998652 [Mycena sp. CBHHK59/15]|nr:hypothetical protein B0H10DRAFT_1998652 [Mycena sp. CBHHK59/15]
MPVECVTYDLFIPAMSRCPVVENLTLHATDSIPHDLFQPLPAGVLPRLKSYQGPHHLAAQFLTGRNAKRVEISVPCKPHRIERSVVKLDRGLEALSFRLDSADLPPTLLETLHCTFPTLSSLAIPEPALSSSDMNAVLNAVPAHHALAHFTARIQGRDKFNLWIPPDEAVADAASTFNKVRNALLKTYPSLTSVRFLYGVEGGSVLWRRSTASGGRFVQVSR